MIPVKGTLRGNREEFSNTIIPMLDTSRRDSQGKQRRVLRENKEEVSPAGATGSVEHACLEKLDSSSRRSRFSRARTPHDREKGDDTKGFFT